MQLNRSNGFLPCVNLTPEFLVYGDLFGIHFGDSTVPFYQQLIGYAGLGYGKIYRPNVMVMVNPGVFLPKGLWGVQIFKISVRFCSNVRVLSEGSNAVRSWKDNTNGRAFVGSSFFIDDQFNWRLSAGIQGASCLIALRTSTFGEQFLVFPSATHTGGPGYLIWVAFPGVPQAGYQQNGGFVQMIFEESNWKLTNGIH